MQLLGGGSGSPHGPNRGLGSGAVQSEVNQREGEFNGRSAEGRQPTFLVEQDGSLVYASRLKRIRNAVREAQASVLGLGCPERIASLVIGVRQQCKTPFQPERARSVHPFLAKVYSYSGLVVTPRNRRLRMSLPAP